MRKEDVMEQVFVQIWSHWQLYASAVLTVILLLILLAVVAVGKLSKFWAVIFLWLAAMCSVLWLVFEIEKYF